MHIFRSTPQFLLRFDMGENVWEKLTTFCETEKISAATFQAIGACEKVILSYYDLQKKEYLDTTLSEDLEILTITGNISIMKDKHIIHAHGSFGRKDLSVVGGHIKSLIVSATCELVLTPLQTSLTRRFDQKTGLNLLSSS